MGNIVVVRFFFVGYTTFEVFGDTNSAAVSNKLI